MIFETMREVARNVSKIYNEHLSRMGCDDEACFSEHFMFPDGRLSLEAEGGGSTTNSEALNG